MKTKIKGITNWAECDEKIKELGKIEFEIKKKEQEMTDMIDNIKMKYLPEIDAMKKKYEKMYQEIKDFAIRNRSDFRGKSKKILNFGELLFRKKPDSIVLQENQEKVADMLLKMGKKDCVKITKKVLLSKLKSFSDDFLKKIGAKKIHGAEELYVKPYVDKIIPTLPEKK